MNIEKVKKEIEDQFETKLSNYCRPQILILNRYEALIHLEYYHGEVALFESSLTMNLKTRLVDFLYVFKHNLITDIKERSKPTRFFIKAIEIIREVLAKDIILDSE